MLHAIHLTSGRRQRLVGLCATISGDRGAAEDLAQETLLEAWRSGHKVQDAVGVETLVQQSVRDEYRGRLYGALGASGALFSLAGAATGGALADAVGIVPALTLASALTLFAGVVVLRAV